MPVAVLMSPMSLPVRRLSVCTMRAHVTSTREAVRERIDAIGFKAMVREINDQDTQLARDARLTLYYTRVLENVRQAMINDLRRRS